MVDRATNIRVRIDIKDAMGKITQMKQGMNSLGATGQRSGTQIQQGMNKATGAINQAGNAAVKNAVNFQTMGQGMLNLSTAGVQTFTSVSNLARAENRAEAASLGLQRAQDLLARKTLAYNKVVETGNKNSREAKLLLNEMETATNDLAVKTDKLKIEQEAVTDVYLLFGANLMNVGVSSLMIYKSMMDGVTKASALNSLMTAKNTLANKLNAISRWNVSKSLIGQTAVSATATGGLIAQTFATKAATVATKLLRVALGPIGLILMAISGAMLAYETNFHGFRDGINSFLGIQDEFNLKVDDGTEAIETQTEALTAQTKAFKDLSTPMQNYITLQEEFARSTGDATILLNMAKLRGAQGFSSGVGSTQIAGGSQQGIVADGGSEAFNSSNNIPAPQQSQISGNGIIPSAHGQEQQIEQELQKNKPVIEGLFNKNPFGTVDQQVAFYEQPYPAQRDTLLAYITNSPTGSGEQKAYIKKYWEIFDISDGFTEKKNVAASPVDNLNAVLALNGKGFAGIPKKGFFAPGFGGNGSIFNFDLDDNRSIVKDALGVDIGAIGNTITTHEAIRLGSIQKSLGKFNVQPSKWVNEMKSFVTGRRSPSSGGIMEMFGLSDGNTYGSQEFSVRSLNQNLATGGRTNELLDEIRAFGGVNANGQTSATAMYQLKRVYNPRTGRYESPVRASDAFYERLRERDYQINSGTQNLRRTAGNIFSGNGIGGLVPGQFGRHAFGFSAGLNMLRETTGRVASQFGSDEQAEAELAAAGKQYLSGEHGNTQIAALQFAIAAGKIADRRIDRVEDLIAEQLGIDFNANSKAGYFYRQGGSKNRQITGFVSTAKPFWEVIRDDIGAGAGIKLPSIRRMEAISLAFTEYGSSWTNFNNFEVHERAAQRGFRGGLGLTEQKIFDIRFDQTRGDRELLNRIRYIEKIEASSSGTSPL